MKKTVSKFQLGEGLFSQGPIDVFKDLGPDSSVILELLPFTSALKKELEKEHGFNFAELPFDKPEEMERIGHAVMTRVVTGWREFMSFGQEIAFTPENLEIVAGTPLSVEIVTDCTELAIGVRKAEEGNSES